MSIIPGRFLGQVAAVTGAARGIGLAVATRLAREGASVAILDNDEAAATVAAKKISSECSATVIPVHVDVRDRNSVSRAIERTVGLGRLDVGVNSAGVTGKTNIPTAQVDPDDWENVFAINSRGVFLMCRAALPFMERQKYGRLVNVASVAGKEGNASMSAYSASKAAVIGLTKVIG
eukprot:EC722787.1.p1 GENE.EC722787.1~~EC722787.1.p1  ORF type:complete len:177 (+),score=10.01 EC722787.1:69-599(+)